MMMRMFALATGVDGDGEPVSQNTFCGNTRISVSRRWF
jgi:hypothetical protein